MRVCVLHLQSMQGYDLLGSTQQMAEKIKNKWTNPEVSAKHLSPNWSSVVVAIFRKRLPKDLDTAVLS